MPSFEAEFLETNGPIKFKDKILVLVDKFPVKNNEKLRIKIEKTNSEWKQGVSIGIEGKCEINGEVFQKGTLVYIVLWEDTVPKQLDLTVLTKKSYIWVKNIWENTDFRGVKFINSGVHGSAMIVEEMPAGRHYYCNDGHPDENFDDIVFTIQKVDGAVKE